jgi:hypothetical protein
MMLSTSAQEVPSKKKGKLEIGPGINIFGPVLQMEKLMVEHGFDTPDLFWSEPIEHPHYQFFGFSFEMSYSHYIGLRSQLGILLHYSWLRTIHGLRYGLDLDILFSNVSVVPLYRFDLGKSWEIQVGPALMINIGNNNTPYTEIRNVENYTKLSPGLLSGLNFKLWDNTYTFGKIGTHYLLTIRNKMGPFTAEGDLNDYSLPDSKIGFSHLTFIFIFGVHL